MSELSSELSSRLGALLFFMGEEISVKKLAELLEVSGEEVEGASASLRDALAGCGLALVQTDSGLLLSTAAKHATLIAQLEHQEEGSELSKTALETLAIVMYKGPVARSEIDFIRGVNSGYSLRNLYLRGLVVRDNKSGTPMYSASAEALQFMGISQSADLPEYRELEAQLASVSADQQVSQETNEDGGSSNEHV